MQRIIENLEIVPMNKDNKAQPAANALVEIWLGFASLVDKVKNSMMLCPEVKFAS